MGAVRKLYVLLNRLSGIAEKVIEAILFVLVLSCAADLMLQVVNRFILVKFTGVSITWTTEYAQDALVWMTYFAVGLCFKENSMASVNVIYDRLKPRGKVLLYIVTRVIVALFLAVGFQYGWLAVRSVANWQSTNLHLPGFALYGAPLLGCVLMAYEAVTELLGVLCGELEPFVGRPHAPEDMSLTEEEKKILRSMENDIDKQ